jgi:hypothetical protein
MANRAQMMAGFVARNRKKRRHPEDYYPNTGTIPGFGAFRDKYTVGHRPSYDRSVPRFQSSTPKQRAPYRKGERFKRKHPYKSTYNRGNASRPHRPTLN